MKHLTDEQLSALLDEALGATELAACEAHLAGCDACRARLAEASVLDESLEKSLTHDPGDVYFESFADRVAARIASEGGATRPQAAKGLGVWGWLLSPRGLALAGSTAALMLVAGLAWMRFHEQGGTVAALRAPSDSPLGSALREQPAPEPAPASERAAPQADAVPTAPPTEAVTPSSGTRNEASSKAARVQELARMQEVRPSQSGEDVPVRTPAPATDVRTRDAGSTTTLGQMKQRAVAPASDGTALQAAPAPPPAAIAPPTASKRAPATASKEEQATRAPAPSTAEGVARSEEEKDTRLSVEPLAPCGSVRDSRGRAVSGAQVMVVNDVTRTARTGPDGSFCLSRLERGDQLSVLRVGYEPVRLTVGDASPLAVVMEPVGTLGPEVGKTLTPPGSPSALAPPTATSDASRAFTFTTPKATAPAPDLYAVQSASVRDSVARAREAARVARRDRSADAMDAAALRWDAVSALVTGAALHDARFQALSLRRESLSAAPTSERLSRFNTGLELFLAQTPHNQPEYATALRWKSQFSPTNKALYR